MDKYLKDFQKDILERSLKEPIRIKIQGKERLGMSTINVGMGKYMENER